MSDHRKRAEDLVDLMERDDDRPWDEDFKGALIIAIDQSFREVAAQAVAAERAKPDAADLDRARRVLSYAPYDRSHADEEWLEQVFAAVIGEARRTGGVAMRRRAVQLATDHAELLTEELQRATALVLAKMIGELPLTSEPED